MAHPTRFERVTFAFGARQRAHPKNAIGHAMLRYQSEATVYFQEQKRRSYPKTRTDFLPSAYVLLTRETVPVTKERHG